MPIPMVALFVKICLIALVSAQVQKPQFLLPFLGPHNWTEFTPPNGKSKPISAIVLAEMALTNAVPSVGVMDFNELMLAAASRLMDTPLMTSATPRLPGFSFLAPNKTASQDSSSTSSAKREYRTSSVSYTHTKEGEMMITSLVINGTTITGTFKGQDGPLLPPVSYLPSVPSSNKSYPQLLGDSLWFYEQQRSGLLHKPNRVSWRNSSALHDGIDVGVDLTGGYFDAGDYINATLSYLAYGVADHIQSISDAQQLGYLDQTLRWGFDWLIKAHPQPHHLYVHIGNTTLDNSYWGDDQHIPQPRPVYEINPDSPGTDAAAGTAAAFAVGAVIYARALNDTSYAQILLDHAGDLFFFAESAKKTLYQISVPAVASAYSSSDYGDELVWAALLMFQATADPYYLGRADHYAQHYSLADQAIGNPVDWDSKHGLALLLGAQLIDQGARPSYDYVGGLERYVESLLTQHKTPAGLLWFSGSSEDASLVQAIDSAYVLFAYSSLTNATKSRAKQALLLAQKQLDYVLGDNPLKRVYITGATLASPKNPQSAMAAGGRPGQDMDTVPLNEAHVLYGALVGGPDDQDRYEDERSNFRQSEIALDYNSLLVPLLAMKAGQKEAPFYASM